MVDNKGFSLIELLVALAVSGIILLGLAVFITSSSESYKMTNDEVDVQSEAQNTMNLMRNFIMEGYDFHSNILTSSGGQVSRTIVDPDETTDDNDYVVVDKSYLDFKTYKDVNNITMHYVVYDNGKLYYYEKDYANTASLSAVTRKADIVAAVGDTHVMAEYVQNDGFMINLTRNSDKKVCSVYVELGFKQRKSSVVQKETITPRTLGA